MRPEHQLSRRGLPRRLKLAFINRIHYTYVKDKGLCLNFGASIREQNLGTKPLPSTYSAADPER